MLDHRMVLHTLFCLNDNLRKDYGYDDECSDRQKIVTIRQEYKQLFSRILFVDECGFGYKYDESFMNKHMRNHLYERWQHCGTLHGFCRYSDATKIFGKFSLVMNNFCTVYYIMSIIALYYRCVLIDLPDLSSRATKKLIKDWTDEKGNVKELRKDFLNFSNVWYFRELTNQDQGIEMFDMHRKAYELDGLYNGVKEEIEKLDNFIEIEQSKSETKAINRLTYLGIPLAAMAFLTGFYGMNLEGFFKKSIINNFSDIIYTITFILTILLIFIIFCIFIKKKQ